MGGTHSGDILTVRGCIILGYLFAVILVAVFLKERLIGADPNRENAISGYIILSDLEVWHTVLL